MLLAMQILVAIAIANTIYGVSKEIVLVIIQKIKAKKLKKFLKTLDK